VKKIILIDGNAILHRAFHALPPLKNPQGIAVNAVYGFASTLMHLIESEKPDFVGVAFDTRAKTFRHEEYVEYKATRVKAPDELYAQIPLIKEMLAEFNVCVFEKDGFEADDVLATIAVKAEKQNIQTYIVTGDMDVSQLINENIFVLTPEKGLKTYITYDQNKVFERYQIRPDQIVDYKGLKGDSSDNIKGVAGVGEKSAIALLQKYQTIENIYKNVEEIKGSLKEKLKNGEASAYFSKKLAQLIKDVPIDLDFEKCEVEKLNVDGLKKFFEKNRFTSLLKRVNSLDYLQQKSCYNSSESQQCLF